jgi:hypothetical protein
LAAADSGQNFNSDFRDAHIFDQFTLSSKAQLRGFLTGLREPLQWLQFWQFGMGTDNYGKVG